MSTSGRTISYRKKFIKKLIGLPDKDVKRVMKATRILINHPEPAGDTKKPVVECPGFFRFRVDPYRIFYTFDPNSVSLYEIRHKNNNTYTSTPTEQVFVPGRFLSDRQLARILDQPRQVTEEAGTRLPEILTGTLLDDLGVPPEHYADLMTIESWEALLDCATVPKEHVLAVTRDMFEKTVAGVEAQPIRAASGDDDGLLRHARGDLVPFLLKLSPEQQRHVVLRPRTPGPMARALDRLWPRFIPRRAVRPPAGPGPKLLQGGPGTGKTTVAIYRAHEMIGELRTQGVDEPRILFVTFTRALCAFARQLLDHLLDEDARFVDVRTLDNVVAEILSGSETTVLTPRARRLDEIRDRALEGVAPAAASSLQLPRDRGALFTEIEVVIQGRGIQTVEEYVADLRPGRRIHLDDATRRFVWEVHEAYETALTDAGYSTFQRDRSRAAALASAGEISIKPYSAVVVDEVQDFGASAIRLLIGLCETPDRFFAAGDAYQSIYPVSFSWDDIIRHPRMTDLEAKVETLRGTHRSTEEIMEGARDYLTSGFHKYQAPEAQQYVHSGVLPVVRMLDDAEEEADMLVSFLRSATTGLPIGSSAVIVPRGNDGERIVKALTNRDVPAVYMSSQNFTVGQNRVRVIPLWAAKGLEFPVVAVAGFIGSAYPDLPADDDPARADAIELERRAIYVAMTRAMRALLVIAPTADEFLLFNGFDRELWNTK